jgi:hypothetical protein
VGIGVADVLGAITAFVMLALWAERRRFIARLQDRLGPNRLGKFGLLRSVAWRAEAADRADLNRAKKPCSISFSNVSRRARTVASWPASSMTN